MTIGAVRERRLAHVLVKPGSLARCQLNRLRLEAASLAGVVAPDATQLAGLVTCSFANLAFSAHCLFLGRIVRFFNRVLSYAGLALAVVDAQREFVAEVR